MECAITVASQIIERIGFDDSCTKIPLPVFFGQDRCLGNRILLHVLRGSHRKKILDNGHDRVSTHGIGTDHSKTEWRHLSLQFLQHKLLERDLRHGSLRVTQKGWGVLNRGDQFWGFSAESVNRSASEVSPEYSSILFELLRTERDRVAAADTCTALRWFFTIRHCKRWQPIFRPLKNHSD